MRPRLTVIFLIASVVLLARKTEIIVGTAAPKDSKWHEILQKTGEDWSRITGGSVGFKILASGVLGDEVEMTRKVRIGQLQAVGLSGVGLSHVEPALGVLQIPMLIDSYQEFDYVRDRLAPRLEALIEKRGFIVLQWSDVGWVHFFTKTPARTPGDVRKLKIFMSAGDPEGEKLYKEFGLKVVPLAVTDLLPSLQTGLIEAFDVPPLFAMLEQSFALARNMIDMKWCPLAGATLLARETWEQTPPASRAELLNASRAAAERVRGTIRKMGDDAVVEMRKRGLNVIKLNDAEMAEWRSEVEAAYPRIRGRLVPADLFDEALRLHREFQRVKAEAEAVRAKAEAGRKDAAADPKRKDMRDTESGGNRK
jgi:TRAP-type C4-dicarboxylate transport system substrate-binding protein